MASPGHTPGHLAYQGPGFLLVGDAMTTRNGQIHALPRILAWDAAKAQDTAADIQSHWHGWLLPAHGEPLFVA
ncbi:hypothetical protein [Sulfobacillus harzensis]|uniref:hypothetical protein n=1 Tax=Sulfobacillus harzensis TaxID=2729629 RepID=UPI00145E3D46|nr:hypothetical protein [Sulfobacillus harzensis]